MVGYSIDAQYAIIQDEDGYTNLRRAPSGNAEIITKIYDHQLFSYIDEGNSQWIQVFVPVDKFTVSCSENDFVEGFIHRSRLQDIKNLPQYKGSDISMSILTSDFDPNNHHIEYREGEFAVSIDGRPIWGRDGSLPFKKVDSIIFNLKDKRIRMPKVLLSDLYEMTDDFEVYYQDKTYFFLQENGDGAGYYEVIWVIRNGQILQRFITTL